MGDLSSSVDADTVAPESEREPVGRAAEFTIPLVPMDHFPVCHAAPTAQTANLSLWWKNAQIPRR
jgi:hypothetical protein